MKRFLTAATLTLSVFAMPAFAQSCGGTYVVKRGESLSLIADRQYKDVGKWTAIHSANLSLIGENPNALRAGMKLRLSFIDGFPVGLEGEAQAVVATEAAAAPAPRAAPSGRKLEQTLNVVTGSDFAPFVHPGLDNDGLVTEIVVRSMKASTAAENYKLHWVNDWASHLDPLLSNAMMDMGFPWSLPDCSKRPDYFRCSDYLHSESLFEFLVPLFVNKNNPIPFAQDDDMIGRTLCRPAGYYIFDLDRPDRLWVTDNKITLKRPQSVRECFQMLVDGEVDGVTLNEFTGRSMMNTMNIKDTVEINQGRPIAITGLHMLVSKDHPNAEAVIEIFNKGLQEIKDAGDYQSIVDRHMTNIWADF